jgi:hypothetical protein
MFELILSLGKCLVDLTFSEWFSGKSLDISTLNITSTSYVSSTLIKLKIEVNTFDDCLYLLDGRLQCLSTLIIKIFEICDSLANIDNKVSIYLIVMCIENLYVNYIHYFVFFIENITKIEMFLVNIGMLYTIL